MSDIDSRIDEAIERCKQMIKTLEAAERELPWWRRKRKHLVRGGQLSLFTMQVYLERLMVRGDGPRCYTCNMEAEPNSNFCNEHGSNESRMMRSVNVKIRSGR